MRRPAHCLWGACEVGIGSTRCLAAFVSKTLPLVSEASSTHQAISFAAFCLVSSCPSKQPDWLFLHCRRTTNDSDVTAGGRSMFSESDMSDVYGDWIDEETQTVVKVRTAVPWRPISWPWAASQSCP